MDQYPLPRPVDLFATLAGGKSFTTLDLSHAYQQLILEESSHRFVTVNTHRGLYRYTRLPYGVASAPAMFQKTMDTLLQGIPGVICYCPAPGAGEVYSPGIICTTCKGKALTNYYLLKAAINITTNEV